MPAYFVLNCEQRSVGVEEVVNYTREKKMCPKIKCNLLKESVLSNPISHYMILTHERKASFLATSSTLQYAFTRIPADFRVQVFPVACEVALSNSNFS